MRDATNRLTSMLALWYLHQLCDLLEQLDRRGALPDDPETVWLVRGARWFVREFVQPVSHDDMLREFEACDKQIAFQFTYDVPSAYPKRGEPEN